jgi:hypothetical protein
MVDYHIYMWSVHTALWYIYVYSDSNKCPNVYEFSTKVDTSQRFLACGHYIMYSGLSMMVNRYRSQHLDTKEKLQWLAIIITLLWHFPSWSSGGTIDLEHWLYFYISCWCMEHLVWIGTRDILPGIYRIRFIRWWMLVNVVIHRLTTSTKCRRGRPHQSSRMSVRCRDRTYLSKTAHVSISSSAVISLNFNLLD